MSRLRVRTNHHRKIATLDEKREADPRDLFAEELVVLKPCLRFRSLALLRNDAQADDLVQDTLERALMNRRSFHAGTNLRAWLTSIMRNLFIDGWRRTAFRLEVDPDSLACATEEEPDRGPLELLDLADVRAAVDALTAPERDLFDSIYFHHASYRTLATRFDLSVNTVGTRLFRAKAKVRKSLEVTYARRLVEAGLGRRT